MKTRIGIVTSLCGLVLLLTTSCGLISPSEDGATSSEGLSNVTSMPCAMGGGSCRAAQDCAVGSGSLGSNKYNCGGNRRVCCFTTCGSDVENVECCNADHTYAPRPTCQDGSLTCADGQTKVPIGTCLAASAKAADE